MHFLRINPNPLRSCCCLRSVNNPIHKVSIIPNRSVAFDAYDINTYAPIYQTMMKSSTVGRLQDTLVQLHDVTGLPWWASIIGLTFIIRGVFVLPLAIHQQYVMARLELVAQEMDQAERTEIPEKVYELSKGEKWTDKEVLTTRRQLSREKYRELILRYNCHPFKMALLGLIQIPVWISLSCAIRNTMYLLPVADERALAIYSQLTEDGIFWLTDLTLPDTTFIFPVILGAVNLCLVEFNIISRKREPSRVARYLTHGARFVAVAMILVSANIPSSLLVYWLSSSSLGLAQNMLLVCPKVRRFCRIPLAPSERAHPFQHFYNRIKAFVWLFRY